MTRFDDEEIARLRAVFGRMSRVLNREVETSGLNKSQLSVLSVVVRLGPIGLGELADIEGINPTMLSRIVGKLDVAGLIRRTPDEQDRRAARVEATPAGRRVHETLRADRARLLAQAVDSLDADDVRRLREALDALEALVAHAQPVSRPGAGSAPAGAGR